MKAETKTPRREAGAHQAKGDDGDMKRQQVPALDIEHTRPAPDALFGTMPTTAEVTAADGIAWSDGELTEESRRNIARGLDESHYPGFHDFWRASAARRAILEAARSTDALNPYALLMVCICRALCMLSPLVVADPMRSGLRMPLNMYVGLIGGTGDAKGLTEKRAARLVPFPPGMVTTCAPASGEAIAGRIVAREKSAGGGPATVTSRSRHVYIDYSEIAQLKAMTAREGNTTMAELLKAYSNERLGGDVKNDANNLTAQPYSYRVCMSTGVQPAHMGMFRDGEQSGLPQRFIWSNVTDPTRPEYGSFPTPDGMPRDAHDVYSALESAGLCPLLRLPERQPGGGIRRETAPYPYEPDVMKLAEWLNPSVSIDPGAYMRDVASCWLPDAARVEAMDARDRRARYDPSDEDSYSLMHKSRDREAHGLNRLVTLAVGLRLLDGPGTEGAPRVTDEQWAAAHHLEQVSRTAYEGGIRTWERIRQDDATEHATVRVTANSEAADNVAEERRQRVLDNVARTLARLDTGDGVKGYRIKQSVRGSNLEICEALDELVNDGRASASASGNGVDWTRRTYHMRV